MSCVSSGDRTVDSYRFIILQPAVDVHMKGAQRATLCLLSSAEKFLPAGILPFQTRPQSVHVTPPPSPDAANPYGTNSCVAPAPPEHRLHTHHPTTCQILWCNLACSCCASAALQQAPPCHSTVHVRQSRRGSLCIGHPGLGLHGHTFCGLLLHIFGKPWVHLQGNTCLIQVSESLDGGQLHDSSKVTTGVLVRSLCVEAAALTQG